MGPKLMLDAACEGFAPIGHAAIVDVQHRKSLAVLEC